MGAYVVAVAAPHQLLLYTDRSTRLAPKQAVRVPEGVPAQPADADLFTLRLENLALNDANVVTAASDRGREYETGAAVALPVEQDFRECGSRGTSSCDPRSSPYRCAIDDALLNQHGSLLKIDVLPAQSQHFADSETSGNVNFKDIDDSPYLHITIKYTESIRCCFQMARILSISYDHRLLRTRELLLQRMGHSVTSAEGFAQAVETLRSADAETFDLVVLGHSIPQEDKRAIIRHCNQTRRRPVLALTLINEPPVWEATRWVDPSDTSAFLATVHELLSQGKADHAQ